MKNNFCITLQLFSLPTPRAKFKTGLFELTPFVIVQLEAFSGIEKGSYQIYTTGWTCEFPFGANEIIIDGLKEHFYILR